MLLLCTLGVNNAIPSGINIDKSTALFLEVLRLITVCQPLKKELRSFLCTKHQFSEKPDLRYICELLNLFLRTLPLCMCQY